MKHEALSLLCPAVTSYPCDECSGQGTWETIAHVSGEAIDADYIEWRCLECAGTGEIACTPYCERCETVLDAHGYCRECDEYCSLPAELGAIASHRRSHASHEAPAGLRRPGFDQLSQGGN